MKNILNKIHKGSERGQAIILVAFAIVGLVAIVGLMIDGGILLIEYARLKRGIDSASIAAASQFRKDFNADDLVMAGKEFLKFNQSDADVFISICDEVSPTPLPNPLPDVDPSDPPVLYHDEGLCFDPPRKLVRITANRHVDFGFMRVVGLNGTDIEATSVGEAASVDMVLVIDTSSSMAYDTTDYSPGDGKDNDEADPGNPVSLPGDDPEVCNPHLPSGAGRCEPLGEIIDVAVNFVQDQLLFYPYDRVALVSTTGKIIDGIPSRDPVLKLAFNNNYDEATGTETTEIQTAIRELRVFQPVRCTDPKASTSSLGGCLLFETVPPYTDSTYTTVACARDDTATTALIGPSSCGSSNIGGSLYMAGRQFDSARQESFWVTIALIGGPATATDSVPGKPTGFCPRDTWPAPFPNNGRGCRDFDTVSINAGFNPATFDWETDATRHTSLEPDDYDADDYARDAADFITARDTGQGATLYSICLGNLCRGTDPNRADPYSGEHLGEYMAEYSGGADANHGLYYFSNDAAGLAGIFSDISDNIFTRISQ